jgi:hypothetical protein
MVSACAIFADQTLAREIEAKTTAETAAPKQDSKTLQDSLTIIIANLEKKVENLNNQLSGLSDRVIKLEQQNKLRVMPLHQNAK